jgi:HEAT repeat protein
MPQGVQLRRLSMAFSRDPASRLEALRQARAWGDRATVPLLLRGLRDCDPAVVREATLAMERFRGRTAAVGVTQAPPAGLPLPRNVARTR